MRHELKRPSKKEVACTAPLVDESIGKVKRPQNSIVSQKDTPCNLKIFKIVTIHPHIARFQ